jgi:hypothetical protein
MDDPVLSFDPGNLFCDFDPDNCRYYPFAKKTNGRAVVTLHARLTLALYAGGQFYTPAHLQTFRRETMSLSTTNYLLMVVQPINRTPCILNISQAMDNFKRKHLVSVAL